jgi:hypothetical protein
MSAQPNTTTQPKQSAWTAQAIAQIAAMEAKSPTWRIARAAKPSKRI